MIIWPHRIHPMLGSIVAQPVMMNACDRTDSASTPSSPEPRTTDHGPRTASATRTYRIIMAGGGTGGHLYPGLAVADALRTQLGESLQLVWAATPRQVDQRLLSQFGNAYIQQPVQPLIKDIKKIWSFWKGWRQSCSFWKSQFAQRPVDAVVALGGYAAGPAAYIASKSRIPVILLNPDALPGLANRLLLRRANLVVTQWALGAEYQEAVTGRTLPLGCPIRPDLLDRTREQGATALGIDPQIRTLVVTGASLGAKTINDAMLKLLEDAEFRSCFENRPQTEGSASLTVQNSEFRIQNSNWQILHLAGLDQAAAVNAAYARWPNIRVKVVDYCDDMASVWAVADLAIGRAGASTCAELTACGVPSILMPYPFHKDLHQKANAMELVRAGAAVIVDDAKDANANGLAVKKPLETLLYDDAARQRMAEAARVCGKPDAAANIAKEILSLIDRKTR